MLNHIVRKPIRKHLARQWRYRDARRLALQHVPEVLEVAVAPPHGGLLQLEGGDVGHHVDFVVGVHAAAGAVGAWVADLLVVTGLRLPLFGYMGIATVRLTSISRMFSGGA
jgi:hypothetical protein